MTCAEGAHTREVGDEKLGRDFHTYIQRTAFRRRNDGIVDMSNTLSRVSRVRSRFRFTFATPTRRIVQIKIPIVNELSLR